MLCQAEDNIFDETYTRPLTSLDATGMMMVDEMSFEEKMSMIVDSLSSAGYDPYLQLQGYLLTGQLFYITRKNEARRIIESIDKAMIANYIENYGKRVNQ